jgi:transcriptional antiterminator RfaH
MRRKIAMDRKSTRKKDDAESGEPGWYCLRSQPKHEHIAAAHLRMLPRVTVFCPRLRFKRITRQGPAWVTEAMFPGYLFAHFELSEMHRQVRYAHGVSGIVQFGGRYPTIDDCALGQLRDQTGAAEIKEVDYTLSQGDPVKIVEGAFVGLEAVVTRVVPAGERVKILMDFLGRKVEAELRHTSILLNVGRSLAA